MTATAHADAAPRGHRPPARLGHRLAAGLLALLLLMAVAGPALAPFDPLATDVAHALQPPSLHHWFGTDALGRDLFSRVLVAARLDLGMAVAAVALSLTLGGSIGALCGWHGGALDRWLSRAAELAMAFPLFVVAMALVAVWGAGTASLVAATALINLPLYLRLARAEVAARRHAPWVLAAQLGGEHGGGLLWRVMAPAVAPTLAVQASVNLGWALINNAGLSFLGLGVRPPAAEWGVLVSEGAPHLLTGHWWPVLWPALALLAASLCFTLCGDALRDRLDPARRLAGASAPPAAAVDE